MDVTAFQCPKCYDIVFSRARHDFRTCTCGNMHVDGGFNYHKIGAREDVAKIKKTMVYVDATRQDLYDDWNKSIDKYGLIKVKQ